MRTLVLGLDIGITSVGYGVIDIDSGDIVDFGVRLFQEGNAKDNGKRRSYRGSRRVKSRRVNRVNDMRDLLIHEGIIEKDFFPISNPCELRIKGLSHELTSQELGTVLFHYAKRRGSTFEMIEEDDKKNKELGEAKAVLNANDQQLKQGFYVCQVQKLNFEKYGSVRGYYNKFRTSDYVKEIEKVLENQRIKQEVKTKIVNIIQRRRKYYEGPGGPNAPTKYGRYIKRGQKEPISLIDKMRGRCSLYADELRAPKMAYSIELFNLLNDLNNLKIENEKLTKVQKEEIISIVNKKGSITPLQIARLVKVDLTKIKGFRLNSKKEPIITVFDGYKLLRKMFMETDAKEYVEDKELLDKIADILTTFKGIEERRTKIVSLHRGFSEKTLEQLINSRKIKGYHAFSFKAVYEMNVELLETEMNQMQIRQVSYLDCRKMDHLKGKKEIKADDTAILSPIAKRAQREAMKVTNVLRNKYGEFDSIVIETTRDKNSEEKKKNIVSTQAYFKKRNDEVKTITRGVSLNKKTQDKVRLYLDQKGKCAYTLKELELPLILQDPTAYEIDHIIPISISLDDSLNNKVLVTHAANQLKGNLTPIGAFKSGKLKSCTEEQYKAFIIELRKTNMITRKKFEYLLFDQDITKYEVMKQFVNRNLIDTSYTNRVVFNTLNDYFKQNDIPTNVHTIRGAATSAFRKRIKLYKDRDENFAHHAIDALIVASIKKLGLFNKLLQLYPNDKLYDEETGESIEVLNDEALLDEKYISFLLQLKYLKVKNFSHKIDTKPNRSFADETIYSTRKYNEKEMIVRKYKDIYDPKFTNLTEDILNGDYQDKYLMTIHDPLTFSKITKIIEHYYDTYKDDKKKFSTDEEGKIKLKGDNPLTVYMSEHGMIRKYSKKENGPYVLQMKYFAKQLGSCINITKNYKTVHKQVVLLTIKPYRTDFYVTEDALYKFVTIRYHDIRYSKIKNKYCIDESWYQMKKGLKGITEHAQYCFSLHTNEILGIIKEEGEKLMNKDCLNMDIAIHDGIHYEILKFTGTNNDKMNKIEVKLVHKHTEQLRMTIGKKIKRMDKFATDPIGNLYKVSNSTLKLEF